MLEKCHFYYSRKLQRLSDFTIVKRKHAIISLVVVKGSNNSLKFIAPDVLEDPSEGLQGGAHVSSLQVVNPPKKFLNKGILFNYFIVDSESLGKIRTCLRAVLKSELYFWSKTILLGILGQICPPPHSQPK